MKLKNDVYDVLTWVSRVFIPALIVFMGVIFSVIDVPNAEVILTIMGGFDVFLGTLLGISSEKYKKDQKGIE